MGSRSYLIPFLFRAILSNAYSALKWIDKKSLIARLKTEHFDFQKICEDWDREKGRIWEGPQDFSDSRCRLKRAIHQNYYIKVDKNDTQKQDIVFQFRNLNKLSVLKKNKFKNKEKQKKPKRKETPPVSENKNIGARAFQNILPNPSGTVCLDKLEKHSFFLSTQAEFSNFPQFETVNTFSNESEELDGNLEEINLENLYQFKEKENQDFLEDLFYEVADISPDEFIVDMTDNTDGNTSSVEDVTAMFPKNDLHSLTTPILCNTSVPYYTWLYIGLKVVEGVLLLICEKNIASFFAFPATNGCFEVLMPTSVKDLLQDYTLVDSEEQGKLLLLSYKAKNELSPNTDSLN